MKREKFRPIDIDNFTPTELRMPVIRTCLHDTVGRLIESEGYKFNKSKYSYKKKQGKNNKLIKFLFYDYYPLNYSFDFLTYVFNEDIEKIKLALGPQRHTETFNWFSLFIRTNDFTNHINADNLYETGYNYTVVKLDDLMDVVNAICKTFKEEVLTLLDTLTTIEDIDAFFTKKGVNWAVNGDFLNNISTDLIVAKLNGKRDHQKVFEDIVCTIKNRPKPNLQTLKVIENLYENLRYI